MRQIALPFLLLSSFAAAQPSAAGSAKEEAANFLQGKTVDGRVSDDQARRISRELAALRAASPNSPELKSFAGRGYDELRVLRPAPDLAVYFYQSSPKEGRTAFACAVGFAKLDKALASLPCESVEIEAFGDLHYSVDVKFREPVDRITAKDLLARAGLESQRELTPVSDPGEDVIRFEKETESYYVFGTGGNDCMSGCLQEYVHFKVACGADACQASRVQPPAWMSLYGRGSRGWERPYRSYDEILLSLRTRQYSRRLQAVQTARIILRGAGLSADELPGSPEEKARLLSIIGEVRQNAEDVKTILAHIAAGDAYPDIRDAARSL